MHCLMSWLFIPDTLHYRAYVTRPVYRSLARTEATINPTNNVMKIDKLAVFIEMKIGDQSTMSLSP